MDKVFVKQFMATLGPAG